MKHRPPFRRTHATVAASLTLLALGMAGCAADAEPQSAAEAESAVAEGSILHEGPSAGPLPEGAVMPPGHPPIGIPGDGADPGATAPVATVLETMDSGGYTYALLEIDGDEIWSAGPPTQLSAGDQVALAGVMGMENFAATSLNRTFERILFVSGYALR